MEVTFDSNQLEFLRNQYYIRSKILNREEGYCRSADPILESRQFNRTEKAILCQLFRSLGPLGTFPAEKTIARKIGCCERTVRNNIKKLQKNGWIDWTRQKQPKAKWAHNVYKFQPKLLSVLDRDKHQKQPATLSKNNRQVLPPILYFNPDLRIDPSSSGPKNFTAREFAGRRGYTPENSENVFLKNFPENFSKNSYSNSSGGEFQVQTKPEETKPEETKPEETKPEETKPEETEIEVETETDQEEPSLQTRLSKSYQCRRNEEEAKTNPKFQPSKKAQRQEAKASQVIRKFEDATRNLNLVRHKPGRQTILDILDMIKVLGLEKTFEWIDYAVSHWDDLYRAEKEAKVKFQLDAYPNLRNITAHWRYNTWVENSKKNNSKEKEISKHFLPKSKRDAPKVSISEAKFFNPLKKQLEKK